jgi:hypothetical protein
LAQNKQHWQMIAALIGALCIVPAKAEPLEPGSQLLATVSFNREVAACEQ